MQKSNFIFLIEKIWIFKKSIFYKFKNRTVIFAERSDFWGLRALPNKPILYIQIFDLYIQNLCLRSSKPNRRRSVRREQTNRKKNKKSEASEIAKKRK